MVLFFCSHQLLFLSKHYTLVFHMNMLQYMREGIRYAIVTNLL